jgi:endoglucanase
MKKKMKIRYSFTILISLITVISLCSCKKANNPDPQLTVNASTIAFTADGSTQDISVSANAIGASAILFIRGCN